MLGSEGETNILKPGRSAPSRHYAVEPDMSPQGSDVPIHEQTKNLCRGVDYRKVNRQET